MSVAKKKDDWYLGCNDPKVSNERLLDLWHSGYTTVQIAADAGMSPGSVRNRIWTLRKQGADLPRRVVRVSK